MTALKLSPSIHHRMEALFQQQMWLWGQDIRAPQGNLLKAYGFMYASGAVANALKSDKGHHSSRYAYTMSESAPLQLVLWSFGLALSDGETTLFTERYRLRWRVLSANLPADLSQLKALPSTQALRQVMEPLLWERVYKLWHAWCTTVADYEDWVLQSQGLYWRAQSLSTRPRGIGRKALAEGTVAQAWRSLAQQLE